MERALRKLRDKAEAYVKKGKYERAVAVYRELSAAEPTNPRWHLKTGETFKRLGRTDAAVDCFRAAAQDYAGQGFLLKAIAMCNLVLDLDPGHREIQAMLEGFHASRFGRKPAAQPEPAGVSLEGDAVAPLSEVLVSTAEQVYSASQPSAPPAAVDAPPAVEEAAPPAVEEAAPPAVEEAAPPRTRTIPPGQSLDVLSLHEMMPEAQPQPREADAAGQVYVIPLEEELDRAFDDVHIEVQEPPAPPPLPEPVADDDLVLVEPELPPTPLFSSLDAAALQSIVQKATVKHFDSGEAIVTEGEAGDSLFVLVEGEVEVIAEGPPRRVLNRLQEGAFFGEIAVITSFTRTCTVEAASDTSVLEISTEVLGELIDEHPAVLKVLLKFFRDRLVSTLVETSELFAPFARQDRKELAGKFQFIEVQPDTVLITEGQPADGLYILLSGHPEMSPTLGPLSPGDIFGEAPLLGDDPAPYQVTATTKCWLLKLERQAFREVIMTHPQVLAYLSEVSATRRGRLEDSQPESQLPLI